MTNIEEFCEQINRNNVPSVTVENYYEKNTFITLLDTVISDFNQRVDKNAVRIEIILSSLFPYKILQLNNRDFQKKKYL